MPRDLHSSINTTSAYVCDQVQKKLQMRIEAQGKYLKTILEKAQTNISFDNATQVCKENREQLVKALSDDNDKDNLGFQLYHVGSQEAKEVKCTPKTEDSLLLDLNIKGGYDLSSRGTQVCELELKINQQIV